MTSSPRAARWGWFPAVLTVLFAGEAGVQLAAGDNWLGLVLVVGLALAGLVEWCAVRRRSPDAQFAADRMLTGFMVAMLVIGVLVGQR